MLHGLHLKNVGPAPALDLNPAPRLNLLTGDNGLGKAFLASRLLRMSVRPPLASEMPSCLILARFRTWVLPRR